jgi:repressor of nif and glnA expression
MKPNRSRVAMIRRRFHQARPVRAFWSDGITPKLVVSIDQQYAEDLRYLIQVVESLIDQGVECAPDIKLVEDEEK